MPATAVGTAKMAAQAASRFEMSLCSMVTSVRFAWKDQAMTEKPEVDFIEGPAPTELGIYRYTLEAWTDHYATWRRASSPPGLPARCEWR